MLDPGGKLYRRAPAPDGVAFTILRYFLGLAKLQPQKTCCTIDRCRCSLPLNHAYENALDLTLLICVMRFEYADPLDEEGIHGDECLVD